jgi:Asp-tRNA(Asn)/Glu-tRNA(Gln) amidotransferase A subunit family amidase
LLRSKKVSSTELTRLALNRLRTIGERLNCVVTLTEELALAEAARADRELGSGRTGGLLHGIPYGIKDLFAVKNYRTTWGAEAFKDQVIDLDATVVERLRSAGAVLCAKLSCGALAYDDVWFGGQTKNPWNLTQGSSGSSAGSASAMAAGLVGFTVGTETLGSIVSPSVRCRTTGLRPSYGRVSRHGGMVLSWTMDKVGPICRSVEDCGIVFSAIHGRDPRDPTSVDRPFDWRPGGKLTGLKIGVLEGDMDKPWRATLEKLAGHVSPVKLTPPPMEYLAVLTVEAASAFEALIRDSRIDEIRKLWPPEFLAARYYPAVEYLRAQQARAQMMETFARESDEFDVVVADGAGDLLLVTTNGTGHPQAVIPWGTDSQGGPKSVSFFGKMDGEAALLTVAQALQETADFHRLLPQVAYSS